MVSLLHCFKSAIPAAPMRAEVTVRGAVLEPLVATNKRHVDTLAVEAGAEVFLGDMEKAGPALPKPEASRPHGGQDRDTALVA
jgi:hypothetical protein